MIKKELKNFNIELDGIQLPVTLPASVLSALEAAGLEPKSDISTARYHTTLYLDSIEEGRKYLLRLSGIVGCARLIFNGTEILEKKCNRFSLFDVSGSVTVGDNLVEIIFSDDSSDILSAGIWGSFELLSFSGAIIENLRVTQKFDGDTVNLEIKIDLYGNGENMRAVATLVSSAGHVYYAGLTKTRGSITVKDPLFWWPRGLGVQNLYRLTVNIYGETEIEDTAEMRIGLRKITTANNADGHTLDIGGVEFLPMGAIYTPGPSKTPESVRKHTDWIVSSAYRSAFNTLVIPECAEALPDSFYELCDVYGIVVIHELSGLSEREAELLRRVGHHASFAPVDVTVGDEIYETCEAMREIIPELDFAQYESRESYPGRLALDSEKTLYSILPDGERNIFSPAADELLASKAIDILTSISKDYLYPSSISELSYLSGVISANEIKKDMIKRRLSRGELGRAVFDGIFSAERGISSCSLDSEYRWRAAQYIAAKFFAPTVIYAENEGACVGFSISNERRLAFVGKLEYKLLDSKNNLIYKSSEEVASTEMSARKLFTRDLSEYLSGHEREYYLEYSLFEGTSVIYRDTLLFCREKEFKYENPKIKYEIVGDERKFSITLSAAAFAKGVEIDFSGIDASLADNFFSITSSAPQKISFNVIGAPTSAEMLTKIVKIRSLYDIGR